MNLKDFLVLLYSVYIQKNIQEEKEMITPTKPTKRMTASLKPELNKRAMIAD